MFRLGPLCRVRQGCRVNSIQAMEVLKITPRGYCHGVVDAFRIAKRVREETNGPVHMLGMLVHNTHATDGLQEQGIELVDQPDRFAGLNLIKEGTVIDRTALRLDHSHIPDYQETGSSMAPVW